MSDWKIFQKDAPSQPAPLKLPDPPPWRDFESKNRHERRATTFCATDRDVEMVNAALYLRRPLLVTGPPGVGKSSLIYAVAYQLGLGSVLVWAINSRSTLQEGLYQYDALARLRDVNLGVADAKKEEGIERYMRLGPLGTALYPSDEPRALLIDEIDKSDVDLPNDLLHVFEEGWFEIPELARMQRDQKEPAPVHLLPWDDAPGGLPVLRGRVQCKKFPFVLLTSNNERDLPPAFLRRCIRLDIAPPDEKQLKKIIEAHFGGSAGLPADCDDVVKRFVNIRDKDRLMVATDQLLNAIYMLKGSAAPTGEERGKLLDSLLRQLGESA